VINKPFDKTMQKLSSKLSKTAFTTF